MATEYVDAGTAIPYQTLSADVGSAPPVAKGVTYPAWTYNGRIPGPTLRAREGERRARHQLVAEDGTRFEASIPEFTLSVPRVLH